MDLNMKLKALEQLDLPAYERVRLEPLTDLDSAGLLLRHKKSGARLAVLSNEDENKVFSIGFKTPPYNNTGLQHILEHSVLCGSKKYPVKDPFVELCKGSLNTFLNAMTYPDKTVYPVASCNEADFKNIMDVYMDAVFYPDIYDKPQIFQQEGWHYELERTDAPLTYNGVVYNEMKGVYSSPEDVLSRHTFVSLFPDTAYRFESGGEPAEIPNLTREEFLAYHRDFYHPSNSYIYLYGDFDVQERLEYLDREYLSCFQENKTAALNEISLQKPFASLREAQFAFAVTQEEPLENNSYLSWNMVVGTSLDPQLVLAMQILDYVLITAPGAKLKQALLDRKIGTDIYSSFETSILQPVYTIVAKNADAANQQAFVDTIQEVLTDIVDNGIDLRMAEAGINYYEFKYREADYGPYPKGLMYYLSMMDSWLYDDTRPFIHIEALKAFAQIREEKDSGLFERLIKTHLLENRHGAVITLVPKRGLEQETAEKEQAKLAAYKAALSPEALEKLAADTRALKQYQDELSSQAALETIPALKLSDISRKPRKLYIDPEEIDGVEVVRHKMFTNKIAYLLLAFDCRNVPEELLPYIGLLSATLGLMDTAHYTYPELSTEINLNSGGISTDAAIYTDNKDLSKYMIMYEVKGKVLFEKIPFVLQMMEEILFGTRFDDYKRLKEIIARVKSRLESSMTNAGHTVAMLAGMAQFSPSGYYSDLMRGYGYYQLIQKLDSSFDSVKEEISAKLHSLVGYIFTKDCLKVSFNADDTGYEQFVGPMRAFLGKLKNSGRPPAIRTFHPKHLNTAYTSSSQVQYVARCGNFVRAGYAYTGALKVLKVIFSYDYLWQNVRVKGGAYGCMSGFARNGDMYMVSYRDPNLKKTNEIYEQAADYIRRFDVSERDMVKFIIGTIGDLDAPLTPSAKGLRSFAAYLCHADYADLQRERMEVLNADVETIRALAPLIEAGISQDYLCVVGNQNHIQEAAALFDRIEPLFAVQ